MATLTEVPGHPGWHAFESREEDGQPSGHLYASTAHSYYGGDCSGTTVDATSPKKLDAEITALERATGEIAA